MAKDKLKLSCPFCKEKKEISTMRYTGYKWQVICLKCGACGPYKDSEIEAIKAFSRRANG